jgi:C-type lectin domain family 10 protein A
MVLMRLFTITKFLFLCMFIQRVFFDHTMFCLDNKMKSVVFENKTEEDAIQKTWGTGKWTGKLLQLTDLYLKFGSDIFLKINFFVSVYSYWTSLTDFRRDGSWVWESTMTVLNVTADYTNWFPGRPNTTAGNIDDCMLYGGGSFLNFWGDVNCAVTARGICELQP